MAISQTTIPELGSENRAIVLDEEDFPRVLYLVPLATFSPRSCTYKWAWSNTTIPNLAGYDELAFRVAAERLDAAILAEPDTFRLSSKDADRLFGALVVEFNALGFHRVNYDNVVTFDLVVQVSKPAGADVDDDVWKNLLVSFLNASRVAEFNALRAALPDDSILDLTGLDLRGEPEPFRGDLHLTIMREVTMWRDFRHLQLAGVNLSRCRLDEAILNGADLTGADLSDSTMIRTNLSEARLDNAKLDRTWLHKTNFNETSLNRTSFAKAEMSRTPLTDVDLSTALGLDSVRHVADSDISFSTLVNSKFCISQQFLRRAGISIGMLEDLRRGGRIASRYGSCFISFSSANRPFAELLSYGLAAAGARTYLDENNLTPGIDLDTQFRRAIKEHDHVITILSEAAMGSEWVARETALALKHRPEGYTPIRLCSLEPIQEWYIQTVGEDETRRRLILSFEGWQDEDRFNQQLEQLLSGLAR